MDNKHQDVEPEGRAESAGEGEDCCCETRHPCPVHPRPKINRSFATAGPVVSASPAPRECVLCHHLETSGAHCSVTNGLHKFAAAQPVAANPLRCTWCQSTEHPSDDCRFRRVEAVVTVNAGLANPPKVEEARTWCAELEKKHGNCCGDMLHISAMDLADELVARPFFTQVSQPPTPQFTCDNCVSVDICMERNYCDKAGRPLAAPVIPVSPANIMHRAFDFQPFREAAKRIDEVIDTASLDEIRIQLRSLSAELKQRESVAPVSGNGTEHSGPEVGYKSALIALSEKSDCPCQHDSDDCCFVVNEPCAACYLAWAEKHAALADNSKVGAASQNGQGWALPSSAEIVKAIGSGWECYTMNEVSDLKFVVERVLTAIKKCAPPSEANVPQEGK